MLVGGDRQRRQRGPGGFGEFGERAGGLRLDALQGGGLALGARGGGQRLRLGGRVEALVGAEGQRLRRRRTPCRR